MYRLVNEYHEPVLAQLAERNDVAKYSGLRDALSRAGSPIVAQAEFQKAYRAYWGVRRRSDAFCEHYFKVLAECVSRRCADVAWIARELASFSEAGKKPALEYSFATKIAHMINPTVPVFDSLVAAFYLFSKPSTERPFEERLAIHQEFHRFLSAEYARVASERLLGASVDAFRKRFQSHGPFVDERVIDWLIWSYASLLQNGAQRHGQLLYR